MAVTHAKILPLDELAATVAENRAQGRRVVHCHGVFDLLHPGHIRHFEAARREGDVLVVTLTPDHLVNKGPGRPVFNERLRLESIAALEAVDHVALNAWATSVETIHLLKPNVYAKGGEYRSRESDLTGAIVEEERAIVAEGGRIHFTEDVTFSSSHLLNAHFELFSPEASAFLESFRTRHSADEIIDLLKSFSGSKALVVGDAIVDEYHFCRPYGMASKSSSIAAQLEREEAYAGGALAVANHLAGFCGEVELITCLGGDGREQWVRDRLKPNVVPSFHARPGAPTTTKRRYVNGSVVTKLFEVSSFDDTRLPHDVEHDVARDLGARAGEADLVVVADFGYRLLGPPAIEAASERSRFLAVNAQSNAANYGYNHVTRYPRADYVCVDSEEARIAYRDRTVPLDDALDALARDLDASTVAVTQGDEGSLLRGSDGTVVSVPVFSGHVIDPIGAGDAFLAVTAPCALRRVPAEVLGFVGNAVGALAVRIVGNKESVEPTPLYQFVKTLLK